MNQHSHRDQCCVHCSALKSVLMCNSPPSFSFFLNILMSFVHGRNLGLLLWLCRVVYSTCTVSSLLSCPFSLPRDSQTPEHCSGYFSRSSSLWGLAFFLHCQLTLLVTLLVDGGFDVAGRPDHPRVPLVHHPRVHPRGEHLHIRVSVRHRSTARVLHTLFLLQSFTCVS